MSTDFVFHVTPTVEDFVKTTFYVAWRRLRWVLLLPCFWLLVAILGLVLVLQGPRPVDYRSIIGIIFGFAFPGFVFVVVPLQLYSSARRAFYSSNVVNEPRMYRISDDGVEERASSFQSRTTWENIVSAETVGVLILLATTQQTYYVIPTSALGSDGELARFKMMLRDWVPNCERLR